MSHAFGTLLPSSVRIQIFRPLFALIFSSHWQQTVKRKETKINIFQFLSKQLKKLKISVSDAFGLAFVCSYANFQTSIYFGLFKSLPTNKQTQRYKNKHLYFINTDMPIARSYTSARSYINATT